MIGKFREGANTGMTLLELLVSLALLAIITAGLASTLNLSLQLYDRAETADELSEELVLRGNLRRWLMAAHPPSRLTHLPDEFTGDAERLTFTTLADTPFAPLTAMLRITVAMETDMLSLTIEHLDDDGSVIDAETRTLVEQWQGGQISYFQDGDDPRWVDQWTDTARLPRLVKIEAEPDIHPNWPVFVVRPRLEP